MSEASAFIITDNGIPQYYINSRVRAEQLKETNETVDYLAVPSEDTYNERLKATKGSTPVHRS